jgi:aryl-alcohol dehydrogenase-like predicted oxidoreductase
MQYVRLGDLDASRIGLGAMGMSFAHTGAGRDDEESVRTIHRALDLGVTFIDTAEVYGPYTNEELVGRAVKGRREVVLATKFGMISHTGRGPSALEAVPLPHLGFAYFDSSPENVRTAIEGSLRRLDTDHVDLYYQHRVDPTTPIEDTIGVLAELVVEGKVRHIGLSEAGVDTIRRANAVHPISALQSEYSLWTRDPETRVLPLLRELGIGFVPYAPLGRGFLTGKVRSLDDFADNDFRRQTHDSPGTTFSTTCASSAKSRKSRPRSAPRQHKLHWPGCWPRATTSRQFRAPNGSIVWRKTSPPTSSNSPLSSLTSSTTSLRPPATTTTRHRCR